MNWNSHKNFPRSMRPRLHACLSTSYKAAMQLSKDSGQSATRIILEGIDASRQASEQEANGAGGRTSLMSLTNMDKAWLKLRNMGDTKEPAPQFVTTSSTLIPSGPSFDVIVSGGTLGLFYAAALSMKGYSVCVIERGRVQGREQEWNISRKEMEALTGILSREEIEECISIEFNPVCISFYDSKKGQQKDVWTKDVLNLGVSPVKIIEAVKQKFIDNGGRLVEGCFLKGITTSPNGVILHTQDSTGSDVDMTARLLIDCMGHNSPIVQQVRWGVKPDGVCCVVGSMASGFPLDLNKTGDVIATASTISAKDRLQLFWEAFPSSSGPTDRTTYMFCYLDAHPSRPSLAQLLDIYWKEMPKYQKIEDAIAAGSVDLEFKRVLFGVFPSYRDSPLKPSFNRIVQVGDASGIQSPLSFGGFGALVRHLDRITRATSEALDADLLDKENLALIHSYNPGLSSAWMLQRAMSIRPSGALPDKDLINKMLSGNFKAMSGLGDEAMRPFLTDVLQFNGLVNTMVGQMLSDPLSIPPLLLHVGPEPLIDWLKHVAALGAFTQLHSILNSLIGTRGSEQEKRLTQRLSSEKRFALNRYREALEFGSGMDFH